MKGLPYLDVFFLEQETHKMRKRRDAWMLLPHQLPCCISFPLSDASTKPWLPLLFSIPSILPAYFRLSHLSLFQADSTLLNRWRKWGQTVTGRAFLFKTVAHIAGVISLTSFKTKPGSQEPLQICTGTAHCLGQILWGCDSLASCPHQHDRDCPDITGVGAIRNEPVSTGEEAQP